MTRPMTDWRDSTGTRRRSPGFTVALVVQVTVSALLAAQGTKSGNPEQHLPPTITQLTGFGERASWSPDGKQHRLHGQELRRRIRHRCRARRSSACSPHYPNAGFLRVQYLPNGDVFLIGARTFTDIRTTRSRDQEMWVMKAGGTGAALAAGPQDL